MSLVGGSPPLHRPMKVTIGYTQSCNLDCRVCYADCTRTPSARELPAATWTGLLDEFFEAGVISVMIEGGEPLHRPDVLEVIAHAAPRAMTRLRTNATLVDDAMAARLKSIGLGDAMVDLLGATAATHDGLTGVPGSQARSLAGIRALRRAGLPVTVLVIMNRENRRELQALLELAHAEGVEAVGVLRPYPLGRMRRDWATLSLSLEEMMTAIAALRPPQGLRLMQSWHPNDANCCWQMAAVNAYGRSIGCMYLREYVDYGDVTTTPFLETWEHPLYRRLRAGQVEASCAGCASTQHTHGGCRSTAYAFHGRWDAPDPFDAGLNDGTDLRVLPAREALPDAP
ncbi:radical SAM additional 4Fe4S-binding SPASM domain-containing protein [Roseomonas rosea]|jgi:radical SAM protein with 4Fe4S-binding SPASM domain|uniref:Radical SAM additional 4Fe4S-binding SPASM domain-containing protein n=1 Tax=Muricoccus roseus TaxID=198092 RepID=A0A1M6D1T9_9PROT|nr:radical SAM protein [Roseomonas rosea]SHI67210.1 radical SAM additional 4Fe4S-binding SPASM domain-containing protein [Roseomonas rosea]